MPGGTNFPVLLGLGCGSQTPYHYDAYPRGDLARSQIELRPLFRGRADSDRGSFHRDAPLRACRSRSLARNDGRRSAGAADGGGRRRAIRRMGLIYEAAPRRQQIGISSVDFGTSARC
jgi:hypothetical protein